VKALFPETPARRLAAAVLAGAALLLAGCYPGGPDSASDLDMVVTTRAPGADLSSLRTYAMPDTVVVLDVGDSSAEPIDPRFYPVILQELRDQMAAAGFTDVTADTASVTPDVWLYAGAVESEVWYYYYYWGYWGGYWPGWGYYPPYVGVGSYRQGTVLWQMVRPDAGTMTLEPLWVAGINGALRKETAATESSIRAGIRQAFVQSPYIQAAPAGQ